MGTLRFSLRNGSYNIPYKPGQSINDIIFNTGLRLHSFCGNAGACGRCIIKIIDGIANPPSCNEWNKVGRDGVNNGLRLACQTIPTGNITIEIIGNPIECTWRSLEKSNIVNKKIHLAPHIKDSEPASRPGAVPSWNRINYGVAIDLGSTHIRASLWNLNSGKNIARCIGLNPQRIYGADILTRLMQASANTERLNDISLLAKSAIGHAICYLTEQECIDSSDISRVFIVGNTAMLTLLLAQHHDKLLQPEFWTKPIKCTLTDTVLWQRTWGLTEYTQIELIPPLAGFIGSDLISGIIATDMLKHPAPNMLIDFGTNSEIAIWDGKALMVTSAAGGPAFEGEGIHNGMPSEPGAIYRVQAGNNRLAFDVIDDSTAQGICGSGLIDIIAIFKKQGIINANGRLSGEFSQNGYTLSNNPEILINNYDIDAIQHAKAAIGAAIICVASQARINFNELQHIFVCGAFGKYLNIQNAIYIGMLPNVPINRVSLHSDAALAGCDNLLFMADPILAANAIINKSHIINLSMSAHFGDIFFENLYLQTMSFK